MNKIFCESVNIAIIENETSADDWELSDLAAELYWWVDLFNIAVFKDQPIPVPVISFAKTRIDNLGHYVSGRNEFGIRENININQVHLSRPLWSILATLVHEMTHSWQAIYGKPSDSWFHNKKFRLKMEEFGIVCDEKGRHLRIGEPFLCLLERHGVLVEDIGGAGGIIEGQAVERPKGTSKLKKWSCPCGQNARVGKKEFFATCDLCGRTFAHMP
jgi:hypothetical protein